MAIFLPAYAPWRRLERQIRHVQNRRNGLIITPSRRIECVAPPGERVVAMTFDGGPTVLPCEPDTENGRALTELLLDELVEFGARGTFNIIGSTEENYPDEPGEVGTQHVFGKKYDHIAAFGLDDMAGAKACPELLRRIAREGHELSNFTYRHLPFGKSSLVYGSRAHVRGLDEAVNDLKRLHELVYKHTRQEMRFMRPPFYIDKMADGHNAFDACEVMGYHYLAASIDGGGYLPSCGDFDSDVQNMVRPLREALERDVSCLAGHIISLRDGYSLSMLTPVAKALRQILELLYSHGYRVLSAGELLERSPFEDVRPSGNCFVAARELDKAGFTTGFRNNRFYPEREMTKRELPMVFSLPNSKQQGEKQHGIEIARNDTVTVKAVMTYADSVFMRTNGKPMSVKRGDVAIWLHDLACLNGFC